VIVKFLKVHKGFAVGEVVTVGRDFGNKVLEHGYAKRLQEPEVRKIVTMAKDSKLAQHVEACHGSSDTN